MSNAFRACSMLDFMIVRMESGSSAKFGIFCMAISLGRVEGENGENRVVILRTAERLSIEDEGRIDKLHNMLTRSLQRRVEIVSFRTVCQSKSSRVSTSRTTPGFAISTSATQRCVTAARSNARLRRPTRLKAERYRFCRTGPGGLASPVMQRGNNRTLGEISRPGRDRSPGQFSACRPKR